MQPEQSKKGLNKGLKTAPLSGGKGRPLEVITRKGNRVYRHCYQRGGKQRHTENYMFRMKRGGAQHYFNLGGDLERAKSLADQIHAFLSVPTHEVDDLFKHPAFEHLKQPRAVKSRADNPDPAVPVKHVPTIGEVCERYARVAQHLSRVTVRGNISALRRIAAHILGIDPFGYSVTKPQRELWGKKVNALPVRRITSAALEGLRSTLIRSAGNDNLKRAKAVTTGNSYIRCAASMFSSKWTPHYEDFALPEPNPFKMVRQLPEIPHRYVSTMDAGKLIKAAKKDLEKKDPPAFLVFILALCCGMRRAEIDRLIWEQVDLENGHVWIRTTEYFRPKAKNSENRIDVTGDFLAILKKFRKYDHPPPFVIPGSARPEVRLRCAGTFKRLLHWLRDHGVNSVTALHTLRKEAGSLLFNNLGSIDLAAEFLRNDPRVAREHYIGRKNRLELDFPELTGKSPRTNRKKSAAVSRKSLIVRVT